ncbi:MAG TPA: cation transporting ATPase C-terminal domain-containing protein, partial [Candidatus Saccharibacteria bacterium]|nr:cation transporting ATPase C-terminal domain-containing protein [Candidatus Saccharibacteria bacterium]
IILLDNNFRSIVQAVHEGRTVYSNIKRMVAYLLATNTGEVIVALGALVVGIPVPLLPVQILWINLATDTCMVIPLGLEPGERRNMLVPPKPANAPLFSRSFLWRIGLTATVMAALTMTLYLVFLGSHGLDYARTVAFHALVVMQWASAFNSRSDYESLWTRIRRPSPAFYVGLAAAVLLQLFAMSGAMHTFLGLSNLSWGDLALVTGLSFVIPIVTIEIHKWIGRHFFNKGSNNTVAAYKQTLRRTR